MRQELQSRETIAAMRVEGQKAVAGIRANTQVKLKEYKGKTQNITTDDIMDYARTLQGEVSQQEIEDYMKSSGTPVWELDSPYRRKEIIDAILKKRAVAPETIAQSKRILTEAMSEETQNLKYIDGLIDDYNSKTPEEKAKIDADLDPEQKKAMEVRRKERGNEKATKAKGTWKWYSESRGIK
jgi:hypothetical protein